MKMDNNIKTRPKCQKSTCSNHALILFGNMFVCGGCYSKAVDKQNEMMRGFIEG